MPVVFSNNTGKVIAITDKVAAGSMVLCTVAAADGSELTYKQHRTIITRIGMAAAGNFQFLHTIGNDVYVYVFGDRMGQVVLHGLSFAQSCSSADGSENSELHGFEMLYEWYRENRIAARKAPVVITIGTKLKFKGFVIALTADVQDSLHRTVQFQMTIATMPDA